MRLDTKVVKVTSMETNGLVQQTVNNVEAAKRSWFYGPVLLVTKAETPLKGAGCGGATERGHQEKPESITRDNYQ